MARERRGMRKPVGINLLKSQALLKLAEGRGESARIRWRGLDLGSWRSAAPLWLVMGEHIRFQFRAQGRLKSFLLSSVKPMPGGLNLVLAGVRRSLSESLEVIWREPPQGALHPTELWSMIRGWLKTKFAGYQLLYAGRRSDPARTLSGLFLRVYFRFHGGNGLLVAAHEADECERILGQALLWLSHLLAVKKLSMVPAVHLWVPRGSSAPIVHRCRHLNRERVQVEIWEYGKEGSAGMKIRKAPPPPHPKENKDFRWPVLGPFRWSSQLEKVLNLAPDLIRRYPRFQDYDSLRIRGLEFARAMGPKRDRLCFGAGEERTELSEDNFERLRSLVEEILQYRKADSPDTRHPYYRMQAERWLESLILEDVPRLFPEMAPESVYSQIPLYLGKNAARIDILGADRQGTLIVMELKLSADPDLPLQALDYWGRVIRHNENGDFERRGYFSEVRLTRRRPRIYLVSPVFSFHDSIERLLRHLDADLEVWKVSINENWREGVTVLRRVCCRCGEMG
jgi:hypothetical protein